MPDEVVESKHKISFATGHTQEMEVHELSLMETLLPWNESNHECMLFSNENHAVHFLSLSPKLMTQGMHPMLLRHLEMNNIAIGSHLDESSRSIIQALQQGQSLDSFNEKFYGVLCTITNKFRTVAEASSLLGGKYCITSDSLLKMLAIFVRVRCGVPVILMGECGCGKTQVYHFLILHS